MITSTAPAGPAELASLRAEVDAFMARAPAAPDTSDLGEHVRFLVRFQRQLHEAGLAVVGWPARYGGRDLGPAAEAVVAARLGELGAPEVANYIGISVLAPGLLAHAAPDRLDEWLPPMADASMLWCQLFSEPDAGSDLAALRTRAEPDGDGWRITGHKIWSTWGQYADRGVILARTGSPEERHRGITAFVIDMDAPGIEARGIRAMTGDAEFAEVFLDGVRVGPEGLVGRVGGGWAVTMDILAAERGPYAVHRASVLRKILDGVIAAARRGGPGHLAGPLSPRQRQLVTGALIDQFRLERQIDRVVAGLAGGGPAGAEAPLTKRLLADAEQSLLDAAAALLGSGAIAWDGDQPAWVTAYLFSRAASIYGGSAQIQRNLIGERLLGLPR